MRVKTSRSRWRMEFCPRNRLRDRSEFSAIRRANEKSSHASQRLGELHALADGVLELAHHAVERLLLVGGDVAEAVHRLDALLAEGHLGGEEGHLRHGALHVGALHDARLAVLRAKARVRKQRAGVRHGERRAALARLGRDHLGAAVLRALGERVDDVIRHRRLGRRLRPQREDRDAGVAAHHRDVHLGGLQTVLLGVKRLRAHDVQRGDAEELLGVVHASFLEHLRGDGHGGVHRVGDHVDHRLGAVRRDRVRQTGDNARVDLEQIVAGHAGLAGYARGDDHDVAILQRGAQLGVAGEALHLRGGVDVRDVRGDAGGAGDVVQGKLRDQGVHLHEQAAGLADTAGGAQDGDLVPAGLLHRLGGGAGNAGGAEKSGHGVSGEGLRCRRG
mmetsp:Transcript_2467/g.9634  ORF Transcript_2467/g.9634 Transcript_2467/m.9634 type:complete len:389 (-) Transcript_2467:19-1185(-)